jgi:hypothetical protein
MVAVFTSSEGRYLSDSVVNSHEVGVLRKLGDDFSRVYPLSLTCYRGDRHEALFGGGVHPVGDLIEGLCEGSIQGGSRGDVYAIRFAYCRARVILQKKGELLSGREACLAVSLSSVHLLLTLLIVFSVGGREKENEKVATTRVCALSTPCFHVQVAADRVIEVSFFVYVSCRLILG